MRENKTPSIRLFEKYHYLARQFSNKLFSKNKLSYERDDVIQDLSCELYRAILKYGQRYLDYQEGIKAQPPIPLKYYLMTTLNNQLRDMMRTMNNGRNSMVTLLEDHNFDYGMYYEPTLSNIDLKNGVLSINNFNVLQNLKPRERQMFCLYLQGFKMRTLCSMYESKGINVKGVIGRQREFLQLHREKLTGFDKENFFVKTFEEA